MARRWAAETREFGWSVQGLASVRGTPKVRGKRAGAGNPALAGGLQDTPRWTRLERERERERKMVHTLSPAEHPALPQAAPRRCLCLCRAVCLGKRRVRGGYCSTFQGREGFKPSRLGQGTLSAATVLASKARGREKKV